MSDIENATPNAETIAAMDEADVLAALRWFAEHPEACGLDVTLTPLGIRIFPSAIMRDHLVGCGLVKKAAPLGMYLFSISDAGRAMLDASACLEMPEELAEDAADPTTPS